MDICFKDERILGDGEFTQQFVLDGAKERLEERYRLQAQEYDLDKVTIRVSYDQPFVQNVHSGSKITRYQSYASSARMSRLSFTEDEQLVKKILKHLGLWDVKRKPTPRANGPPSQAFIIYDESSSPGADNPPSVLLLRRNKLSDRSRDSRQVIQLKPTYKKNPAPGKPASDARIDLKLQPQRKKLILTIKAALVIWMVNVGV
jgi:hypothetical protein